jgi:hypothetical protein
MLEHAIDPIPKKLVLNITKSKLIINPVSIARFSIKKIW